jgi:peptidoglycan/LPS O-acetylase OafA/YrhL
VIVGHAESDVFPWTMHDGRQAVQVFYMISGFYMAMVLSSRYKIPRDFYVSRFMRIFPPYWIAAVTTVVLSMTTGLLFQKWMLLGPYVESPLAHNGLAGLILTAASNFTLFGQDCVLFLSHDSGQQLHLTTNFRNDASPLWRYLLVPQCWSVGIELAFYASAPFLNRLSSRWLVLIALGSFTARLITYWNMGGPRDPWTYRFFPFELGLFLLGMLGYRLYARTADRHPSQRFRCVSRLAYSIGAVLLIFLLHMHIRLVRWVGDIVGVEAALFLSYLSWVVGIPALFFIFGNQRADRSIGELSYPIYLIHMVVIGVVGIFLTYLGIMHRVGVVSALISVIASAVFYRLLIAPLDRKRHNLTQVPA